MKILITGAGGFIGSHLVEHCVENGYDVRAFVRYNSSGNFGWLETSRVKNEIEVIPGDIRDYDSVYSSTESVDVIFHLAALIGIPHSYISPMAYIRTNIEGTYNVLESARQRSTEQVLITSTSETYGTAQYVPVDEKHPHLAQSPYAATKIAADQMALSYHRSFDLPVKIIRPFNTYGPRQSARAIIPTIVSQIVSGQSKVRLGNLNPTRDLTFVKDTVSGITEIMKSDKLFGEVTNIGMNEEISIGDLAKLVARLMNKEAEILSEKERTRPDRSEVMRLCCDNTKIIKHTSWKPMYNLETGLQETIEWVSRNIQYYKPDIYSV
jgi:NAD dependent epimerase/dehydratase